MSKTKSKYDILIIEDEKEVAEILRKYLMIYAPFRNVAIAHNSFQATQKLSNQKFDLIVTDIQLGSQDVFNFIDKVKRQPKYYKMKFMVVSGCLTTETTLKLMRYGIRNIIVKPFTVKQVLIHSISCLGIEKKPQETVDRIIGTVKERFISERGYLENAVPDSEVSSMIKHAKNKKD
ncbi:MAG: response regulator [Halobacteriovoraceae bacterium]|nr:response regulator [Halobacteriovoraceae bacterium]MCB9095348.1 response regulator [Halobacteriovoraceae bacterium]